MLFHREIAVVDFLLSLSIFKFGLLVDGKGTHEIHEEDHQDGRSVADQEHEQVNRAVGFVGFWGCLGPEKQAKALGDGRDASEQSEE